MGNHVRAGALRLAFITAALMVGAAVFSMSAFAASPRALINTDSAPSGLSSPEAQAATAAGFQVDAVNGSQWDAMSQAQFGQYQLLIVGDPTCGSLAASVQSNVSTWAPVVMGNAGGRTAAGNRILIGTDPVYHYSYGGRSDIVTFIRDGIKFAGEQPGRTGIYLDQSCAQVSAMPSIIGQLSTGTGSLTQGYPPCGGNVGLTATDPSFADLRDSNLAGWGCSVHVSYPSYPSDWNPLAVATDASTHGTCGTDQTDGGTRCGEAYILIAGSGIVVTAPDLKLTPASDTAPAGGTHTVTANVAVNGTPQAGALVSFTVVGQNAGALGTCLPAGCMTDALGNVTFTYTDTAGAGDDTITARYTSAGTTQQATAAMEWTKPLDLTPPSITHDVTGTLVNGWYTSDVGVSFTVTDDESPITSETGCDPVTVTADTASQTFTCSAESAGGPASDSVTISRDATAPSLSGAATSAPNADGWYNGDVTVDWTCSDAMSGLAGDCPDTTITGEGSGLESDASVSDAAGNSTSASVTANIDRTAPDTTASAPSGWVNGPASVAFTATDALSGVAATYYSVDGGATESGPSATIGADGTHTVMYWSVDKAGNIEPAKSVDVSIDTADPTISAARDVAPNANGWNNTPVTVTFTCGDALSGVASCSSPQTFGEGAGQAATGTAVDNAGNSASTTEQPVNVDETAPTVTAAADRAANGNGWYNAPVTVTFSCTDGLSGVADCPAAQTVGEGANQSVSGTGHDKADNAASASVTGLNVDTTAPSVAPTVTPSSIVLFGSGTVDAHASDAGSGLDSVSCGTLDTSTAGTKTFTCTATDKAGNVTTASASYTVFSVVSMKQDALARITALAATASKNDAKQLSDAASKLSGALTASNWTDGIRPTSSGGVHVFDGEKQAIDKMNGIAGAQPIIDELVAADQLIASTAIADAVTRNGNAATIASARSEQSQAAGPLSAGRYADGLSHLKNAWQTATRA